MRVSVKVNGNGDGKGTHIDAFFHLLEGNCDNQLHWPFVGIVTYELLNQLEDNNHHRVIFTPTAKDNMIVCTTKGFSFSLTLLLATTQPPTPSISLMIHCTSECQ